MTVLSGKEYFRAAADADAGGAHTCPVCADTVFSENASYEICDICGWEDDPVQLGQPDLAGGANKLSLNEALLYWRATGKKMQ